MERHLDLVRETVEATLAPGRRMSLTLIERVVRNDSRVRRSGPLLALTIDLVLRSHPDRFVQVARGVWARRSDGPEAGVHSRLPRCPLAGGAAAAVVPPEPARDVEAVARSGLAAG